MAIHCRAVWNNAASAGALPGSCGLDVMVCAAVSRMNPVPVTHPPRWASVFRSDDLDEVRAFVRQGVGEHSRVAHGAGPLGFSLSWVAGTSAAVGWARAALEKTVRGAVSEPTLHVCVPEGSTYLFGRRRHTAHRNTVVLLAPGQEFTRRSPAGSILSVSLRHHSLADEIEARSPGSSGELVFRSRHIELSGQDKVKLVDAVQRFAHVAGPAAVHRNELRVQALFLGALADVLTKQSAVVQGRAMPTRRIADLEAWIEANLEEPLTVGRLCAVAGVGERSLQKTFESRRGVSPMRFVVERRLAAAHLLLRNQVGTNDVTNVAVRLGFSHVGRFAQLYRTAYGETPSQTRRRALGGRSF
jgi:AraC-like DNA-binding protein